MYRFHDVLAAILPLIDGFLIPNFIALLQVPLRKGDHVLAPDQAIVASWYRGPTAPSLTVWTTDG